MNIAWWHRFSAPTGANNRWNPRQRLPPGNVIIALVICRCNSDVVVGGAIGRDRELGYLAALLAQLEDGPTALVYAGEPGGLSETLQRKLSQISI
jgi:hypothetical protein